ncbi:MAG: hypothetical protein ACQEWG_03980 [Bacteroidota bacterium]
MVNLIYGFFIILVAVFLLILLRNNRKQKQFIKKQLEDLKIIKEKNSSVL